MSAAKDEKTEALRQQITKDADFLVETDRADTLLITLSFQSSTKPERHVWIDTQMGEDGGRFTVDLEDWTYQETWDNAVATVETDGAETVRAVTHAWLRGEPLDACLQQCAGAKVYMG
jgi:hypothetical protein